MSQLECKVEKGPMAHEYSLMVPGMDGEYETWADPRDVVIEEGDVDREVARGLVAIKILEEDLGSKRVRVRLPSEVVMGTRLLWVPASRVRR
jgi:hypothetical protein